MDRNLLMLPDEILLKIVKDPSLSIQDIFTLSEVCLKFKDICESEDVWKSKFIEKWPWTWKKISHQNIIQSWKKEVCSVMELTKKIHEVLDVISYKLYKFRNITAPVLASVTRLFSIGTFGSLYCLNELREIHSQSRDLTEQYYALRLLQHVHQLICEEEWKKFFSLPLSKQTLEKGAFFFAKWFQPVEFLNLELNDITAKLDDLALQVLSHLRKQYPNHHAVSHSLLDPNEPLTDNMWSKKECQELFKCVNYVLYSVNKYTGNTDYYLMDNSFINKVMQTKRGIPITLSIVYHAICHRLGIILYPVNCPSHFMMKWRPPGTDEVEFIDAFKEGRRTDSSSISFGNHPSLASRENWSCSTSRVLERMAKNTLHVGQRNFQNYDMFTEMCLAAQISSIFKPNNEDTLEFMYSLNLSLELHVDRIILGCSKLLQAKPHLNERFGQLKEEAEALLKIQIRGRNPPPEKRRKAGNKVTFATGMIMVHKLYGYICVIFGWDTKCKMSSDWKYQVNIHTLKYKDDQPFYNVLVSDGSQRYAAQENLLLTEPVLVPHEEIGKYFDEFNGHHYVANYELAAEYPDERLARDKYFPNLKP